MLQATRMAVKRATVTAVGVDWLTATSSRSGLGDALWGLGERLIAVNESEGQHATRWHGHGYEGWATNHLALGAREESVYLRLSGVQSAKHWLETLAASEHCTRIDLAVDAQLDPPVASLARECYMQNPHRLGHSGRPSGRKLIIDTNGGSTCYFGSRSSTRFGRVYDKGRESKTLAAGTWWRWELEAKAEAATALSVGLVQRQEPRRAMASEVARFFMSRGAIAPVEINESAICNGKPERPTDLKLLEWLAVGVRPTVQRLTERLGEARVLHALGFPLKSAVSSHSPEQRSNDPWRSTQPVRSTR